MDKFKTATFWVGILGALKLASDALGIPLVTNDQVNAIANGLAAIATVVGVFASHTIKPQEGE